MTAMHSAAWLPDPEGAPRHAWPDQATRTANVNDNQAADVYWDTLIQPQTLIEQAPQIDMTATPRRFWGENALYGLAGAVSLVVALACLIAR